MSLLTIKRLLIFTSLSVAVALASCQSTSVLDSKQTTTLSMISTKDKPIRTDKSIVKESPILAALSITNELLAQYDWQLVSAVSNTFDANGQIITRKPIGNFYHPNYPISVSFGSNLDNQYVYFSSSCNGSGAPYTLSKDNTLSVDSIVSTDMGCGETGNRIETALFGLMGNSSSKLTLSLQPLPLTSESQVDFPRYNLLQTTETGETLVWQNEKKQLR